MILYKAGGRAIHIFKIMIFLVQRVKKACADRDYKLYYLAILRLILAFKLLKLLVYSKKSLTAS